MKQCVFMTAGPNTKLFPWARGYWRTCATRDDEPRPVWTSLLITHGVCALVIMMCVFITAGPSTKLFACGGGELEDMCYERRRAKAYVN